MGKKPVPEASKRAHSAKEPQFNEGRLSCESSGASLPGTVDTVG